MWSLRSEQRYSLLGHQARGRVLEGNQARIVASEGSIETLLPRPREAAEGCATQGARSRR